MKFTYPPESRPLEGYTIKRGIERGGFGEVYYALSDGGKEVALKLLQQNMDVELRGVSQCLNLKHPNLVTIFDIRRDADGDHWIVMEYVTGDGLDKLVARHPGGMPIDDVLGWLSGIAAGLTFLHDRGIVHRDLKPANVYREDGCVKIGDVGLSKFISESRRNAQTQSVGTVYYMAPEVAHGRYGREVDIYALGVVLYEMLTGRVPFDGESTAEILMKHLSEKPDLAPLPKRLRPVIAHALEKDPLRRTASVAQLEDEFRRAVRGIEIAAEIPVESFAHAGAARSPITEPARPHRQAQDVRISPTMYDARRDEVPRRAGYGMRHGNAGRNDVAGWWRKCFVVGALLLLLAVVSEGEVLGALVLVGALFGVSYLVVRMVVTPGDPHRGAWRQANHRSDPQRPWPAQGAGADARVAYGEPAPAREHVVPVRHYTQARPARIPSPSTPRSIALRCRLADMTASMASAALCTLLITGALSLVLPFLNDPGRILVFGTVTLVASWAVIAASKLLWEGTRTDGTVKRLTLLGLGALVGVTAWWTSDALLVGVDRDFLRDDPMAAPWGRVGLLTSLGPHELIDGTHQPTLAGFVVFFAGLLALRRWWRHADAFRKRRFRVASLLLTVGIAYLVAALWSFPPLWGITWAATISSVVQLASVWVPPDDRLRLVAEGRSHARV
jgi:eukaryotic-like serine/threonine-protein kinase